MQIDWSNIQTVLLDMDGTLLDLHFDNYFWQTHVPHVYATKHGLTDDDAYTRLVPMFSQYVGTLEWYCVDFWSEKLDLDIMRLKRDVAHKIGYRANAQIFLEKCREQTRDVRLITNAHRKVLNLKIEHTGIDRYFDSMHCSHELDYPKEMGRFWHNLQETKAFDPQTTLFLDDSESVLQAAEGYGISHIFSIAEPDSQKGRETPSAFEMIDVF